MEPINAKETFEPFKNPKSFIMSNIKNPEDQKELQILKKKKKENLQNMDKEFEEMEAEHSEKYQAG